MSRLFWFRYEVHYYNQLVPRRSYPFLWLAKLKCPWGASVVDGKTDYIVFQRPMGA